MEVKYIAAMAVTGVLRTPMGKTIPEGIALYRALTAEYTGMSLMLLNEPDADTVFDDFCLNEGLVDHTAVVPYDIYAAPSDQGNRLAQVTNLRLSGYALAFVVEPDPDTCALLISKGYNTLLFTHAEYAYPDWRPDASLKPRPWTELSQQVADQARLRAEDKRTGTEV
jgi:hypothetical protein